MMLAGRGDIVLDRFRSGVGGENRSPCTIIWLYLASKLHSGSSCASRDNNYDCAGCLGSAVVTYASTSACPLMLDLRSPPENCRTSCYQPFALRSSSASLRLLRPDRRRRIDGCCVPAFLGTTFADRLNSLASALQTMAAEHG